jgi:hypothetical protein
MGIQEAVDLTYKKVPTYRVVPTIVDLVPSKKIDPICTNSTDLPL